MFKSCILIFWRKFFLARMNTKNYSYHSTDDLSTDLKNFKQIFAVVCQSSFAKRFQNRMIQFSLAKLGIFVEKTGHSTIRNSRQEEKADFHERVRLDPLLGPFIRHFRCDIKPIANVCVTWRVRRRDSSRRNLSMVRGIISAATAELWNYHPRGWLREHCRLAQISRDREWKKKKRKIE